MILERSLEGVDPFDLTFAFLGSSMIYRQRDIARITYKLYVYEYWYIHVPSVSPPRRPDRCGLAG